MAEKCVGHWAIVKLCIKKRVMYFVGNIASCMILRKLLSGLQENNQNVKGTVFHCLLLEDKSGVTDIIVILLNSAIGRR